MCKGNYCIRNRVNVPEIASLPWETQEMRDVDYFCAMSLLLCAATRFEIQPTIDFLNSQAIPLPVRVIITGVGLTAATYHITKAAIEKPGFIIQAGVAGNFNPQHALGSVLLVKSETLGDLGVMENGKFISLEKMGLQSPDETPWDKNRLINPGKALFENIALPAVPGVTVQEITTDETRIKYYKEELLAELESLEGAALHYVGLMEKIPFLQIRAVSNHVGERNKANWKLKEAIENLNKELQSLLLKLTHT